MKGEQQNDSLDPLLERLCIDKLADDEWRELAAQISGDEQALRRYVEAVQWRQSLGYLVPSAPATERRSMPVVGDATAAGSDASSSWPRSMEVGPLDPHGVDRSSSFSLRSFFRTWAVAVSLAFLAGAGLTAVTLQQLARSLRDEASPATGERPTLAAAPRPTVIQESELGQISGLSPEASADGLLRSLKVGQNLRCGEVVQLMDGFMRVVLHSGPELIIEGPAEFSIVANDIVFVRVGRVTARGTEKLLLQSPLLGAECHGAEVAFEADEDTSTSAYAYKGVVAMRSTAPRRSNGVKLAVLRAGQGLQVRPNTSAGELSKTAIGAPGGAIRSWSEVEAKFSEFERLVLSDQPVAYWPLLRVRRNRRVLDLTQHGYDGQAIGNWPVELDEADSLEARGAFFNGECYVEPDRKPPIDIRKGFTVEGWAKVMGGPNYQAIFTSRWVLDAHTPHLQCLGFTLYAGKDDCWELWTGSGRYGQLWKEHHSGVPLVRNEWTHVLASFEPDKSANNMTAESVSGMVRIYINGKLASKEVHEMSLLDFEWPARIGAAEFVPNSLTAWLFRGTLRDIAVYNYPLEAERILAHYEAGKNAGG